ncbi:hypothetical protein [Streptomyces sp. NPDC018031]|uniref:hypothetical protein n=1 Tax=Streptomyces sp. NPDC018031 TaxID=3365033 RepID=UPI0037A33E03
MDAVRVALLREVLAGTEWLTDTRRFGGALRAAAGRSEGLLLVGCEEYEPWHLAAHLREEADWSGLPGLRPTLVRHRVAEGLPAHLSVGLGRLEAAGRGETLLVVSPGAPGAGLLERVHDARRSGATVFALEGGAEPGLHPVAHEVLAAPPDAGPDLETVQHLVSAAAGENARPAGTGRPLRDRLSRLAERLTAPPPRW